jgi:hypothetical protein
MAVGVDPWSMSMRREGFGLVCRLVAPWNCSGRWEIWEHRVHVPREANITGVVLVGCAGCGRAVVVVEGGQGRAGQGYGMARHGMAWHGDGGGTKDRLWS